MMKVGPTSLMISFPDEMGDVPIVPALPDLGADKRWLGTELQKKHIVCLFVVVVFVVIVTLS